MIRILSIVGIAAFAGAILLLVLARTDGAIPAVLLLLLSVMIGAGLAIRRVLLMGKAFVGDARAFLSGRVQRVRLVDIEDPEGIFNPTSAAVFELEGEDGAKHRFEREIPVPFFTAWSYRAAKRLPVPNMPRERLSAFLALELKREGLKLSFGHPEPAAEPAS